MKIFRLLKKDNRNKRVIYENANNSFDFDYSVQLGTDENNRDKPLFTNANKSIDRRTEYEMKEVDYYA